MADAGSVQGGRVWIFGYQAAGGVGGRRRRMDGGRGSEETSAGVNGR